MIIRTAVLAATRALSLFPGVRTLRARFYRFLNSNRWLHTARIGGITTRHFVRGVFSPTTLSTGYLGYQLGSLLFPNAVALGAFGPINVAGAILVPFTTGIGATYKAALNIATHRIHGPLITQWVQNYPELRAMYNHPFTRQLSIQGISQNYIKGFKPGPITRLSSFLYNHPLVRLPFTGAAIGVFLAEALEQAYGINPWTTIAGFGLADWFWQVKGHLTRSGLRFLRSKWLQPTWHLLKYEFASPRAFFSSTFKRFWLNLAYGEAASLGVYYERPWFEVVNKLINKVSKLFGRSLQFARPYLQNFFNPGFFLGFGLAPFLIQAGVPAISAYIAGPLIGGVAWWSGGLAYQAIAGKGAIPFPKLTAYGWWGYFTGLGLQFAFGLFGISLPWLPAALSIAFPLTAILLPLLANLATSSGLLGLIGNAASSLIAGLSALTGIVSLGVAAFYLGIIGVAIGTIYIGFVVISAFWSPFSELDSTPIGVSECFEVTIEADCSPKDCTNINPGDLVSTCTTYKVLQDPLLLNDARIQMAASIDPQIWDVQNNWTQQIVTADRTCPSQPTLSLNPNDVLSWNDRYKAVGFPVINPYINAGFNPLIVELSVLGKDDPEVPLDQSCQVPGKHLRGKTLTELAQEFPSLQGIPISDTDKEIQIALLEAQLTTVNKQISTLQDLSGQLTTILNSVNAANPNLTVITSSLTTIRDDFFTLITTDISNPNHPFYTQAQEAKDGRSACGSNQACIDQLTSIYQNWAGNIKALTARLTQLILKAESIDPNNPNFSALKADLEDVINNIIPNKLILNLKDTLDELKDAIEQIKQINPDQEFYYVEGNTIYQVCWKAIYTGNPGEVASQSVEITANQAFILGTSQPYCQTQNTVYFNQ